MGRIDGVKKLTDNSHVNLYQIKATSVHNTPVNYFLASRSTEVPRLKLMTRRNDPDGVVIYSLYGENHDKVVLVRQYRYTIGDYIYEFPAGLIEPGENDEQGAVRELKEETGLTLTPVQVDPMYRKPFFTTIGMTDESCSTVYGYASGQVTNRGEEDTEEIEIVLADRQEVRRILREEKVAIMCAYMLMHFLTDEEPFAFLKK
ncbi:MAG: NUDIX hydrolase [Blautia sp.]|nr:NUDIX hydrolase [Blautia sp.]